MAYYYEKLHANHQECEREYEARMEKGDYRGACEIARRGLSLARGVAQSKSEPAYMRSVYGKHAENWEIRLTNAEKMMSSVSASGTATVKKSTGTHKVVMDQNDENKITFDSIAGLKDVKRMMRNKVVAPLKKPEVAKLYKKKPSKTVMLLLYGPPGTGKSMFAEAVATDLEMSVHRCSSADIIGSLLGESTKNMQAFIDEVVADDSERIMAFIDEFDALAGARSGNNQGADGELNRVVNQLLQCIDALVKSHKDRTIIFVTTTNLPWAIDSALLRGRRFDTQIYVGLPDQEARRKIVHDCLDGGVPPLASDINLDEFADSLKGYSGADITTICDKLSDQPLFRHYETEEKSCVTKKDIKEVLSQYPPSVSESDLAKYDAYNKARGFTTPKLT